MRRVIRWLSIVLVLCLVLTLVISAQMYIVDRLVDDPGWFASDASMGLLTAAGVILLFVPMLAERLGRPPLHRLLTWPGYLWMGASLLLLVALGFSDLVLALMGAIPGAETARLRALLVVAVVLVACVVGVRSALRPTRRKVRLMLPRWPEALDGYRIVQLTDLHIGPLVGRRWAARVVAEANKESPDCIVVTGDLVDGMTSRIAPSTQPLADLRATDGVFAITGNHEMFNGVRRWLKHFEDNLGLRFLANERVTIERDGAAFDLAGTHDRTGKYYGLPEDLDAALAGRGDTERPLILLAHDPTSFRAAAKRGVDLQLSGHTHGGQIWPFHAFVRLFVPFLAGHHEEGESQLYVSRGTGFWGPPIRLGAPPEITEIVIYSG